MEKINWYAHDERLLKYTMTKNEAQIRFYRSVGKKLNQLFHDMFDNGIQMVPDVENVFTISVEREYDVDGKSEKFNWMHDFKRQEEFLEIAEKMYAKANELEQVEISKEKNHPRTIILSSNKIKVRYSLQSYGWICEFRLHCGGSKVVDEDLKKAIGPGWKISPDCHFHYYCEDKQLLNLYIKWTQTNGRIRKVLSEHYNIVDQVDNLNIDFYERK